MPRFYDSKGKPHTLGEQIGRGGEGTVYFCAGNEELVAKIYHDPISDEKARKLQLMAENKNERLLKVAAWVVETLHDKPHGKVIGFLMPSIKAKEIHELYSLKSRRRHFPQATWHYLIHTSANLARAFYSLHKYSHVIGDVNHGNCVVLADGTVKLIDCDSYAISNGETRFACEVGVATHLAPELQKANLSEVERKPEHDNFALAVVIFQLLFLGRHPFAGNYIGKKDKTLEDCISEFRFAYGKNSERLKVKQPPGTLHLNEVSPRITDLFERAFDEKMTNRPTPREWIEALVDMSENLAQCGINPGHRFFNDLPTCPWCRIESQTGLMLFPFVFSEEHTDGEAQFNIFTVEKLIENLGMQRNLPAKLEKPNSLLKPEPAKEIIESTTMNRNHQFLFVGGYFIGLITLNLIFGLFVGTILGIFLMVYLFSTMSNDSKKLQNSLMFDLSIAENEWEQIEKEFALTASPKMFAGDISAVKQKVKDYKNFQLNTRKELKLLESGHNHRKFTDFLRKFRLENNEIEGISAKTKEDLVKRRVWTAAEIDKDRLLNNYKVNAHVTTKLLEWRNELEKKYTYDDKSQKLQDKKEKFLEDQRDKRRRIEMEIERTLESIRKSSVDAQKNQSLLSPRSEEISKKILQCKSNLEAVGDTSVALASLILITILVPFFGGITSEVITPRQEIVAVRDSYPSTYSEDSYGGAIREDVTDSYSFEYSDEVLSDYEAEALAVPDKDITREALEQLGDETRKNLSDNLVRQAIHLIKKLGVNSKSIATRPIKEANEKVLFAVRVKVDNAKAFEEFGIILYDYRYFKESLSYLSDLENLTVKGHVTQMYIGMNHLQLGNFAKARDSLLYVTNNNGAYEPFFNLGLAYKGLKEYTNAAKAFRSAIELNRHDIDSHYELGYAYFKLRDKEGFNKQYAELLDMNPEKASELLKNSYKLPPSKKELENINTGDDIRELAPPPPPSAPAPARKSGGIPGRKSDSDGTTNYGTGRGIGSGSGSN